MKVEKVVKKVFENIRKGKKEEALKILIEQMNKNNNKIYVMNEQLMFLQFIYNEIKE